MEQLKIHIQDFPLTKRTLASILMGTVHDPLQLMAPYVNNLKLIYRDLCRISVNTSWDEGVPEKIKDRLEEALQHFFNMEQVEFQRKAVFIQAKEIVFKIYFDGSKEGIGVSVLVKSILPNDEEIFRLLCNKSKLVGDSVNTAPRSELCACLVSSRIYSLIQEQLQTFLEQFKGKVNFQILGDSLIVLNQIKKNSYNFHTYAAARIQEIRESTLGFEIEWAHVSSENNLADILTRSYSESPEDLPWAKYNIIIIIIYSKSTRN